MSYNHRAIEAKWQRYWKNNHTFQAQNPVGSTNPKKPPYYVLDMFPYPSGAGLHVGHPLGYIASDIVARYKRHKGYNVLHPMGYDSFGLPAEQYAIQTGQHPAITTATNVKRYREQLDQIGFSYDWSREVRTSDPQYYRWTQWIFLQLFESWYDETQNKARPISELEELFSDRGNRNIKASCDENTPRFSAEEWHRCSETEKEGIILSYRLAYLAETRVNWCPELGTVLANDEVVNGVSERGGFPVVRKTMKQWIMRITAYADRLLDDLKTLDWPESLKETQRNWIGRSEGALITFKVMPDELIKIKAQHQEGDRQDHLISLTSRTDENAYLFEKANEFRHNPTDAEKILWARIENSQLGCCFYAYHVIGDFIANFISYEKKLIIEIDRDVYAKSEEYEQKRTALLNELGFEVLHFKHDDVKNKPEVVIDEIRAAINQIESREIKVFSTRPDTIYGVDFMTLAPEHPLVTTITTPDQKSTVEDYIEKAMALSERERQAQGQKKISGVFTGAYAEHPFTKRPVPIWVGDYVLGSYGTGAVMAVPSGDERDYKFAKHFAGKTGMPPISSIFAHNDATTFDGAFDGKEGYVYKNSEFLNGLTYEQAFDKVIEKLEKIEQGKGIVNYRLRDAVFSRQRYWGEPFPIYYKNGLPHPIPETCLPLKLPEVEKYLPTADGKPPLGRAKTWYWNENEQKTVTVKDAEDLPSGIYPIELNTMPGWAGSSWYFFRYMETANRDTGFASPQAQKYWKNVDLYLGGSEHATGHLLYARFWTKFLFDRGLAPIGEPFKKLLNQGMILGESAFVYRIDFDFDLKTNHTDKNFDNYKTRKSTKKFIFDELNSPKFFLSHSWVSSFKKSGIDSHPALRGFIDQKAPFIKKTLKDKGITVDFSIKAGCTPLHTDVNIVGSGDQLDIEAFKKWRSEYKEATFIVEKDDTYKVGREVEKMSKSKFNVVNPDAICAEYGADTLRLSEMFLGPIDQDKPWNTDGLSGVYGFLKKLWILYCPKDDKKTEQLCGVTGQPAPKEALKTLHQTIKKVTEAIENYSFNTAVSALMICVNDLTALKCRSREVLDPLVILVSPYAPHIAEELWERLGHENSITEAPFPLFEEEYVKEDSKTYPISFNGKTRFTMELSLSLSKQEIQDIVMTDQRTQKRLQGQSPKRVIVVPGKIVNIVR